MKLENPGLLQTQAYIDGQWVSADNGDTLPVMNPSTGEEIVSVASCGAGETRRAIEAADAALPAWRARTAKERANILRRWYELMMANQRDLALIIACEQGKSFNEALGEIAYAANYIEWFAEEAKRIYGDIIAPPSNDKRLLVVRQPVGVVASITPWNYPSAMITRKVAPALAAGCTFVAKPAAETPLSAFAMAVLAEEAGFPPGIFNVVWEVGKLLISQCAETVKKVSMELGGNAPFIVFDDADIEAAVSGAMASKYRNSGQTCVCANRILVQDGVYDAFAERLTEEVRKFRLGNAAEETTTMGPLVNVREADKVQSMVDQAIASGARALSGGERSTLGECFVEPTVLVDANEDMRVFHEEIFGPVAPLFRFSTEEEAVAMANDTRFGLASYFYTRDMARIWRVSEALEYGMVGINEGIISNEMAPFGGIKESGSGREGSKYGIDDYVEMKYLCMAGLGG
jgi:succinate-semialdehyde dehydrogenase/glutarate-semialdehyde dehydrogenase